MGVADGSYGVDCCWGSVLLCWRLLLVLDSQAKGSSSAGGIYCRGAAPLCPRHNDPGRLVVVVLGKHAWRWHDD